MLTLLSVIFTTDQSVVMLWVALWVIFSVPMTHNFCSKFCYCIYPQSHLREECK